MSPCGAKCCGCALTTALVDCWAERMRHWRNEGGPANMAVCISGGGGYLHFATAPMLPSIAMPGMEQERRSST